MGIYRRYAAAFLIFFASLTVQAGQVNVPKRSVEDLIKNVTPVLSENALGYVRAEGDYPFTYNNKAYTAGPILQTTKIPKTSVASVVKNGLKINPAQLALDATIAATLSAVGWVMTDGVLTKKTSEQTGSVSGAVGTNEYYFYLSNDSTSTRYGSATDACSISFSNYPNATNKRITYGGSYSSGNAYYYCSMQYSGNSDYRAGTVNRVGSSCPSGTTYDSDKVGCYGSTEKATPVSDSDFSAIDTFISGKSDPDFLNRALKASCEGSLAPARCYQSLQDAASHLHSGPTSVKGPTVSSTATTANTDGTTSTSTTKQDTNFKLGYNADGFTWTPETTKTVTGADGKTTTETTTEEDNSTKPEEQTDDPLNKEYSFEDKDFPEVKPFYEQKYKDGFKTVWENNQASFDNSAFISFLKSFVPSFSGSCPAFGLNFNIATWANYGSMDFMSICYVLDFVKSILLVSSLFLCRALIFGG
ncbi:Uncharacterised protein [Pseudomonas luteola]|uniref:Uncharacterized protein n=1 Tax=Pseudomonas luteola TaxID=47886 RepID=A0A2X2C0S5_PSELU|nr:hypothetical protein [Pseudomonas luteola]SPZ02322.1 Uncharacterised protein [Pseudomonas luteola]